MKGRVLEMLRSGIAATVYYRQQRVNAADHGDRSQNVKKSPTKVEQA